MSDGFHIASLLLGFFAEKMTFLIEAGMVYILDSPLYKQGNRYIYNDEIDRKLDKNKPFKRFKGLGELNLDETRDVITGSGRRLLQVTMDNIEDAMQVLVDTEARNKLMVDRKVIVDWREALFEMSQEQDN